VTVGSGNGHVGGVTFSKNSGLFRFLRFNRNLVILLGFLFLFFGVSHATNEGNVDAAALEPMVSEH
jgi:hypothetical protein